MWQVRFTRTGDPRYLDLVWNEFFVSRGRGLALEAHFPWMLRPGPRVLYAELLEGDELVGGLVLRDSSPCVPGIGPVASVGLVCLREGHRGKGLSRILLAEAIGRGRRDGFAALTLWTGKPGVYEALGFRVADRSLFGWVDNPRGDAGRDPFAQGAAGAGPARPLPPFARELVVLAEGEAYCAVAGAGTGPIVVEHRGAAAAVTGILGRHLPRRWRLNASLGDPLLEALGRAGMSLELRPGNLQMWLPLEAGLTPESLAGRARYSVLDRI